MSPRYNAPVSSFGAELHEALRRGSDTEFRLTFDTPTLAKRFQHRINHLRAAMKKENHRDWEQLYRCGVHIDSADPKVLILAPRDSEFRSALSAAQIGPEPLPIREVSIPTPLPEDSAVDSFLGELTTATAIPPKNTDEG